MCNAIFRNTKYRLAVLGLFSLLVLFCEPASPSASRAWAGFFKKPSSLSPQARQAILIVATIPDIVLLAFTRDIVTCLRESPCKDFFRIPCVPDMLGLGAKRAGPAHGLYLARAGVLPRPVQSPGAWSAVYGRLRKRMYRGVQNSVVVPLFRRTPRMGSL
jgi:hypothetical protein